MRHTYVEDIARTFCCIRELIGKEISCASDETTDDEKKSGHRTSVCAYQDTDWLHVVLSAAPTRRFGELVQVNLGMVQKPSELD